MATKYTVKEPTLKKADIGYSIGGALKGQTSLVYGYIYKATTGVYYRLSNESDSPFVYDGSGSPDMDYMEVVSLEALSDKVETCSEQIQNLYDKGRLKIKHNAGLMDFSVANGENVMWELADGSISYSNRPSVTLNEGISYLNISNLYGDNVTIRGENTGSNFEGDLSDFSWITYYLSLYNATKTTGDLSSLKKITNLLSLNGCELVTGNLSEITNVEFYFNVHNCQFLEGIINLKSTVETIICDGTNMSSNDTDQTLINLYNNTTIISGGILTIKSNRTSASNVAFDYLSANGWTITEV